MKRPFMRSAKRWLVYTVAAASLSCNAARSIKGNGEAQRQSAALSLPSAPSSDEPEILDFLGPTLANVAQRTSVRLLSSFYADSGGAAGQCDGGFVGSQATPLGSWSEPIVIDTDDRPGGCSQRFGVWDPGHALDGVRLTVSFEADGDPGQCGNVGDHAIPVVDGGMPQQSDAYGIDSDSRPGGCLQTFTISGREDVALDVEYLPTGDPGQCGHVGLHSATSRHPLTTRLDTDGRPGGCKQRFRLRRTSCGAEGQVCCPGNACDSGSCRSGICEDPLPDYSPCPHDGSACTIMPTGDSITWGSGSSATVGGAGYRPPLFQRAFANGHNITFVGSQADGPDVFASRDFPKANEGYPGSTIAQLQQRIGPELLRYRPRIVTLLIGTNDLSQRLDDGMAARLATLIDTILASDPDLALVLSQVTPSKSAVDEPRQRAYNDALLTLVQRRAQVGRHIVLADTFDRFIAVPDFRTMLFSDDVHPSDAGYRVLADSWYDALRPVL